ncbi:MAG: hypothetical protein IPL35_02155 [Sphingobacteriales bacterium]|nr:hypothetical protein [Sphingobacteriales bacterium]
MSKISFIPRIDSEKDLWLKNFAQKLNGYTAKYGITAAEVSDMQAAALQFSYWLDYRNKAEEYVRKVIEYKNEVRDGIAAGASASPVPTPPPTTAAPPVVLPGVFKRAASIGKRIKSHIAYTIADGNDLGLEGTQSSDNGSSDFRPLLKVRLGAGGQPEVQWKKENHQGIQIYADRGEGKGYEYAATDLNPHYLDAHPLPLKGGVWKYKAIYIQNDHPVGQWSDEVSISVHA